MSDFLAAVATPLDYVVTAPLLAWREIAALALPEDGGWTWAVAIIGMTATIRVLMLPAYVGQLRVRRELLRLEPEIRALEKTYAHDPEQLLQERMKLVRAVGVKPVVSLLPVAFLGLLLLDLLWVLNSAAGRAPSDASFRRGVVTRPEADSLAQAKLFGGRITDAITDGTSSGLAALSVALIAVMCVTQVIAQRQKAASFPADLAAVGPVEQKAPSLLIAVLVGLVAIGLFLPVGVLIFWATSKVWTVGQLRALTPDPV